MASTRPPVTFHLLSVPCVAARRARAPWRDVARTFRDVADVVVESRPTAQGVMVMRLVGAALVVAVPSDAAGWARLAGCAITWVLASMAVYVANGLSDLAADRRNGSTRPLAAGRLTPATARVAVLGLAGAAVVGSSVWDGGTPLHVIALLVLGALYSFGPRPAKARSLAAVVVVVAAGLVAAHAGGTASGAEETGAALCLGAATAAWMAAGALLKDFGDVAGDQEAGRRTCALVLGVRCTGLLALLVTTVATGMLAVGAVQHLLLAGPALALGVATAVIAWRCSTLCGSSRRASRAPYRAYMVGQYAALALVLVGAALRGAAG